MLSRPLSWLSFTLGFLAACGPSPAVPPARPRPAEKGAVLPFEPPAAASPEALRQLARSSNAFGFDLYQRLRGAGGNLIVSPASVTTALAMTWGGARGETAAEMKRVLHFTGTQGEVMAASGQLARSLQQASRPLTLRIANQLFAERTYPLERPYAVAVQSAFGAPVESLDFRKAPEKARLHVNQWVEKKTEKRIRDLIPQGAVDDQTRLILVNAVYFLAKWGYPFESNQTRPAPFRLSAGESRQVPTMSQTLSFRTARRDGVTAVELPYQGKMSMLVFVPDEIGGLPAFESSLEVETLEAFVAALKNEFVRLSIPKFELNPASSLRLSEELKALGMPLAFDRQKADFTGIADPPDRDDRLAVAEVFHKGFVRVDEEGTEAAAATAVMAVRAGSAPAQPRLLAIDRPFLFLIRDDESGLVLFLGRVTDPSRS